MVSKYLEMYVFSAVTIWHQHDTKFDCSYFCWGVENVRFTCVDSSLRCNLTSGSACFL